MTENWTLLRHQAREIGYRIGSLNSNANIAAVHGYATYSQTCEERSDAWAQLRELEKRLKPRDEWLWSAAQALQALICPKRIPQHSETTESVYVRVLTADGGIEQIRLSDHDSSSDRCSWVPPPTPEHTTAADVGRIILNRADAADVGARTIGQMMVDGIADVPDLVRYVAARQRHAAAAYEWQRRHDATSDASDKAIAWRDMPLDYYGGRSAREEVEIAGDEIRRILRAA